jgi:hypothetical protein
VDVWAASSHIFGPSLMSQKQHTTRMNPRLDQALVIMTKEDKAVFD